MRWRLALLFTLLLAVTIPAAAQDDMCPALVRDALEHIGDNCSSLDRNSACYGFTRVESTFASQQPANFFTAPADRAALLQIQSLTTHPLDLGLAQWGLAVMNVQANVPNTLPGQAVVFILMGDAEVGNVVEADTSVTVAEPVSVQLQSETRVFSEPDRGSAVVAILAGGSSLQADAFSPDGDWLRVLTDNGLGWIRRQTIEAATQVSSLNAAEGGLMSPMQSFQLRTGFGDLACSEAPSLLAIQSPEGITVDLNANGAHIRMGSLVALRVLEPGDVMQAMTIEGDITLDPQSDQALQLLPGFSTTRCLDADGNIGDTCDWTDPQPLTAEELLWAQTIRIAFAELEEADGTGAVVTDGAACADGTTIQYTVQSGDTLFSLGQRYNTTVSAIVNRNGLTSSTIFVGQTLTIVCGEQGPPGLPAGFDQPSSANPPPAATVEVNDQPGSVNQPPPRPTTPPIIVIPPTVPPVIRIPPTAPPPNIR